MKVVLAALMWLCIWLALVALGYIGGYLYIIWGYL
jgi:hypothetical protein